MSSVKWKSLLLSAVLGATGCGLMGGGCGPSPEQTGEVTGEGVDITKNPFGALSALKNLANKAENLQKEMEEMEAVEPLHFSALIEALPDVPDGWTADDAKGQTTQMGATAKISTAQRTYRQEGGDGQVRVEIADWAYNKVLYMPYFMASQFSQESTDGYQKGITLGEWPGTESYKYARKSGERSYLPHKRYQVKIAIRNAEPDQFDVWTKRVKTDKLPAK